MTRSLRGISLVESLVVLSIVLLLFSLLFPVLQSVKWRIKETRSLSNMRQIQLAVLLYAQDYDGGGVGGLGLPPEPVTLVNVMKLDSKLFQTGGVPKPSGMPAAVTWMPPPPDERYEGLIKPWEAHVAATERSPILLVDDTFNQVQSAFATKKAQGIFLDGHAAKRRTKGELRSYSLWE